jgi:hypothetical protein
MASNQGSSTADEEACTGIFVYSTTASNLFRGKSRAEKENFMSGFLRECASPDFRQFVTYWGLENPRFERNVHAVMGNHVFDRFLQASANFPDMSTLAIVFHGTFERNIPHILRDGLDPKIRSGQAYGVGEYFATEPGLSTSYCRGDKKMLVFVVVVPLKTVGSAAEKATRVERECPLNMVVVPTAEHQLPLGVLSFDAVSPTALTRSQNAQARLMQLSAHVRAASEAAAVAATKAKIIQALIQHGIDVASEVYAKNKDCLCELSKREISMYAHRVCDGDVVQFYMPDLPPPMSCAERDSSEMKSVNELEDDLTKSKLELARERSPHKLTGAGT